MLIRDALHGDIDLSPVEAAVLDSPELQRLRGIKQLGTAYLVYPGAVHSRFEHSLGTCATAHRIVDSIRRAGTPVDAGVETAVGVAALLHDVTHVPFGHTLEDERRLFPRHDEGDRLDRLLAGGLGATLDRLGLRTEVTALLAPAAPRWDADIVSSTIDADLLDYLRRDSLYAGLAQSYDDRVFRYFTVRDGRLVLDMNKHGMTRPDAWSEIVQLLRMRYFLTERVYYHHTKVVAGAMISKAVEIALDAGAFDESSLLGLNDWSLLFHLSHLGLPPVSGLIERLERRDLYKRAFVLSARTLNREERKRLVDLHHRSRETRSAAEREIAAAVGASDHEIIVYCPALTLMKEAAALIDTPQGRRPMNAIDATSGSEIKALADRHAALWRLYVFSPARHADRAGGAAAELFGRPSEYDPKT